MTDYTGISLGVGSILGTVQERIKETFEPISAALNDARNRSQSGGTPDQAIATTWRDPMSYAGGATQTPSADQRNRKRGGTNTF